MKAGERDEFLRAAWRVMVTEEIDARDFVFVDECGAHASLAPVYGYAPRGERVHLEVPRNRGPNTTLLASMGIEGMGECLAVEMVTTKVLFEAYVQRVLAPSLRFETKRLTVREDFYVSEWVLTGTLALPWRIGEAVAQPNGKQISFAGVDIMTCEDGKIKLMSCWIDSVAMQQQLGLSVSTR